jgi:sugar lactone lactonase YvrE
VRRVAAALGALAVLLAAAPGADAARARWNTVPLALVQAPFYPAMAYVAPNGRIYEGTYDNPSGDTLRSRVFEYDGDGTMLRSWTLVGQDLSKAHGVQVGTSDAQGRLILLDKSPPRIVRLDPKTGGQSVYATFPEGSIPNYSAWGPDGSLYVTDYGKPTIWRVPPGGGTPQAWLTDSRLDGGEFGTTGLALQADRKTLLVAQQSEAGGAGGNPSTGRLFALPIGADGKPGPMRELWESGLADGPDGFGIAKSGDIYVALLVSNQIVEVGADGKEKERFPQQRVTGDNGSSVPFDSPSSVRFLGTRLIVAQQSYFSGNTAHMALLDVESGEPGLPEFIPGASAAAKRQAARKGAKLPKRRRGTLRGRTAQKLIVTLGPTRKGRRTFTYQGTLDCSDGTSFTEGRFSDDVLVRRGKFRMVHTSNRGAIRTTVSGTASSRRASGRISIVERYRATLDAKGTSPLDRRGTVVCRSGSVRWSAR